MAPAASDVNLLVSLSDDQLFAELGRAIISDGLEMLPDESEKLEESERGRLFFSRCLPILRGLICNQRMAEYVRDEKKRDAAMFVATFIDVISGYFGLSIGTILLVQVYKKGVDRFCDNAGSIS